MFMFNRSTTYFHAGRPVRVVSIDEASRTALVVLVADPDRSLRVPLAQLSWPTATASSPSWPSSAPAS